MALLPRLQNFIWGPNGQPMTPDQVERLRAQSESRLAGAIDTSPVGHWSQGAARLVNALGGVMGERRANRAEQAGLDAAREKIRSNPALSGYFGGSPVVNALAESPASPPAVSPVVSALVGGQPQQPQFAPDGSIVRQGLIERGLPEHIADAFVLNFQDESGLNPGINEKNPIVAGSRGGFGLAQWTGPRRRALEAFAAQRGAPVDDMNTQLDFLMAELQGPEAKAAERIFSAQDTPTAAAAIVNSFLRPAEEHRARREAAYLGGASPSYASAPEAQSPVIPALMEAMTDPWVQKEYGPVIQALMGQEMQRQNAIFDQQLRQQDPMYQAQLAKLTAPAPVDPWAGVQEINGQLVQMTPQGPQVIGDYRTQNQYRTIAGEEAAAMGLDPNNAYNVGPDGKISQIGGGGVTVNMGSEVGTIPQGFELITDPETGARSMRPIPGGPEDKSQQKAMREGMAETAGDTVVSAANRALEAAQNRALGSVGQGIVSNIPWTDSAEVKRQVDVLKAMASSENINAMRQASPTGGALGNASDADLKILRDKSGALDPSSPHFERDLADYARTLLRTIHGPEAGEQIFRQTWKGKMDKPQGAASQAQPARRRWTPDGGLQ